MSDHLIPTISTGIGPKQIPLSLYAVFDLYFHGGQPADMFEELVQPLALTAGLHLVEIQGTLQHPLDIGKDIAVFRHATDSEIVTPDRLGNLFSRVMFQPVG